MDDGVSGGEASSRCGIQAAFGSAGNGSNRTASLRVQSKSGDPLTVSGSVDDRDVSWWQQCDVPGSVPEAGRPRGIAESTNKQQTAFTTVPNTVARELYAAAPHLAVTPTGQPASASPSGPAAPASQPGAMTGGNVQFVRTLDHIPGEVPPTPGGRRAVLFVETLDRSFARTPLGARQQGLAPGSPERTSRFAPSASIQRFQSSTRQAMQSLGRHGPCPTSHLEPLDSPEDIKQLQLEITLQHSTSIEKVSASELKAFAVVYGSELKPFVNGGQPSPAQIRAIRGVPELRKGAFYVPSELTDAAASGTREVVSGVLIRSPRGVDVVVQLFVLFPSLMRPPRWLRTDFTMVKRAVVEVDWQLSRRTQALLYCFRRLQLARSQTLGVWASRRRYGLGEVFKLFGAEGRAELTDRSYVLLLKFYNRRVGPGPRSVHNLSREGPGGPGRNLGSGGGGAPGTPGEIDFGPPSTAGTGQGGERGQDTLGATFGGAGTMSFGGGALGRGYTRMEALQEVQQQLLLRAQSSDVSGQIQISEVGGLVTWDGVLDYVLAARDGGALRRLIDSHYLDHLLKSQVTVDKVEKVAFANNDAGLMMILYQHTTVEMDLRVLAFLVHCWAVQPLSRKAAAMSSMAAFDANDELPDFFDGVDPEGNMAGAIEEFLVKYVIQRRNPLSSTAAILRAIDDEMNQHEENRRIMRLAASRFHSFHVALLKRLNRYAELRNLRLIERILQPAEIPNTVNEVSPLQVAFDSCDLKFMTETLIELYVKVQWLGRELMALTSQEDLRGLGATNPLLAYAVLKTMGFAGKGTMDPLAMVASRLWHLYVFTSNAFFDSPRGRWAMHVLFELCFLGLYQWQVMYPDTDLTQLKTVHLVFLAFILGNLLDMMQFVHYRYGSLARIRRFMGDPWNALGLLVNVFLLGLTSAKIAQDFGAGGYGPYSPGDALHVCMATLAVFVWVRALSMAVPVYPSLGPLLNTVARMVEEVIAFLFPMIVVMTGFSTMMTAVFQKLVPSAFGNFASAMLQLFSSMLGNFDFDLTQPNSTTCADCTPALNLYAIIVQVIFLVISAILLMNLLIAIINNRYRPQEVEAESQFKKAQIVSYYQTQVAHNLVCSPFCLPQLVLQAVPLLPSGRRDKLSGAARSVILLGVVPLDGVVLPDDGSDRPTGAAEIPHLVFLMTLYPVMAVTCSILFLLYAPFGVIQFASKMYAKSVKQYGRRMDQRKRKAELQAKTDSKERARQGSAERAFKRVSDQQQQQQQLLPPSTPPSGAAAAGDVEAGAAGTTAAAAAAATTTPPATPPPPQAPVQRSASSGVDVVKQYQRLKKALQAEAVQVEVGVMHTVGYIAFSTVLAIVGLLFYIVVLLLLVLVGWSWLYQWVAKVIFSLYNIVVQPYADMLRSRRRRHRVTTGPAAAAAAAALHTASGVGAQAATVGGGHPGAVSMNGCGGGGGGGGLRNLFSRSGKEPAAAAAAVAAAAAASGDGAAGSPEEALRAYRRSKARLHWHHAMKRIVAMKNERYLARRDLLKALAVSKFKPHMEAWHLRADLRSSSQDIMESQMQDLEDDDDPWDDDELQNIGGDDDTLEAAILDRTEQLTTMLRNGIAAQTAAMNAMNARIQELSEQLAVLQLHGVTGGGGGGAGGPHLRNAPGSPAAPPTAPRPAPPPTRPPSVWDLAAELGGRVGVDEDADGVGLVAGHGSDGVLLGSVVRREPALSLPVDSPSRASSRDTERRPSAVGPAAAAAECGGGEAGDGGAAAAAVAAAAAASAAASAAPVAPPPLPQRSPSPGAKSAKTRAKTAPPRPSQTGAPPAAAAAAAAAVAPPSPSRAFAESPAADAPPSPAAAGAPRAPSPSAATPPRPPLPPGHVITPSASGASHGVGGSPVMSVHGSARRSSSAGADARTLQQQRTLDRLLNASDGGSNALLAAIGTEKERGMVAGAAAPTASAARSSFTRAILEPIPSGGSPRTAAAPVAAAPPPPPPPQQQQQQQQQQPPSEP